MELKKVHPGVLAALIGGLGAFLASQFQFSVWVESPEEPLTPPDAVVPPPPRLPARQPQKPAAQPAPVPSGLRVSNQTQTPVRVVLLAAANSQVNSQASYREPVHWDFAPQEGSQQGLILSLPEGNVKLRQGDILTAFALDGSRRYWGPYVVGKTAAPSKRGRPAEWQLVLQP